MKDLDLSATELVELFEEFGENLKYFVASSESHDLMAVNPKAFTISASIEDFDNVETETARILKQLFTVNKNAKVYRIGVTPGPEIDENGDCSLNIKGGTITISGTF